MSAAAELRTAADKLRELAEGVLCILRYRGWRIGRKSYDNSCPACAGPTRPLTPAEYAELGIPMPAEPITDELLDRCARVECGDGWEPLTNRSRFRAALRAAGHPEAGE